MGDVLIFGVTPPYQTVQDYRFLAGTPLSEPDIRERRPVLVLGYEIAEKLFDDPARRSTTGSGWPAGRCGSRA